MGIGYAKVYDIKSNLETQKDKSNVTSLKSSYSLTIWRSSSATNKFNEKVIRAELLFLGVIAEDNLSIATADHAGNLLDRCSQTQNMQ